MAIYRQVHTTFWQDSFVLDLTPEEKYFYLYLMTNSKTTQCGIYEIPKRIMETETGYNRETVDKLLQRFVDYGKIAYNESTKEIMVLNWVKYNFINSPKVKACITKELNNVKYKPFVDRFYTVCIGYGYGIDRLSIDLGEEEEKEEEKEEENIIPFSSSPIPYKEIVDYLNEKVGSRYKSSSNKTKELIKSRLNDGFSLDDFKQVIDVKAAEWLNTEKAKYLRPETLFGSKFEGYLNQKSVFAAKFKPIDEFDEYERRRNADLIRYADAN